MPTLKITKKELLNGLETLSPIIRPNNILSILSHVHFSIENDSLKLTGNNQHIQCTTSIVRESKDIYNGCIEFFNLLPMIKALDDQVLDIHFFVKTIRVDHSKGSFKLPLMHSDDFYFMGTDQVFNQSKSCDGFLLKDSLRKAVKFVSMTGVEGTDFVGLIIGKNISIKSTDMFSLFNSEIDIEGDNDDEKNYNEKNILLSPLSVNSLIGLIHDSMEIKIHYNDRFIKIKETFGDVMLQYKEITIIQQDGNFPFAGFTNLIKGIDNSIEFTVDLIEFKKSIKRLKHITSKGSNTVKFEFQNEHLEISCIDLDFGLSGNESIQADFHRNVQIGYDAKRLLNMIDTFSDDVKLSITDKNILYMSDENQKGMVGPVLLAQ